MKRSLLLLLACIIGFSAFGQTISLRSADKAECVKSDMTGLKASFSFSTIGAEDYESERGTFSWLSLPNTVIGGNVGEPQIPVVNQLIAVPFGAQPRIEITGYSTTDYRLDDYGIKTLVPRQPSLRKDQRPEDVPFAYKAEAYQTRGLRSEPQAVVSVNGMMRGVQLGTMTIEPVSYDPVNNTLRVFNDIEVEVHFDDADVQATEDMLVKTYSPHFDVVYNQLFNNGLVKSAYTDHPDLYNAPVRMLVICYSGFQGNEALNSWLQWKLQKGYYVDIYYTDETGTTSSAIASFIKTKYNASVSAGNAYTYLVVIGDTGQVPQYMTKTVSYACASDLGYASVNFSSSTSNYFPDMYYSRMSVENTTHLTNYINKVLTYEKFQMSDGGDYLNNVILVGGWDSSWTSRVAKPTINYATNYYFKSSNTTYGGFENGNIEATVSTSSTAGYAGTATGTSTTMGTGVYTSINSGVGFLNYTAHGDRQEWYQPKMTAAQVACLSNADKYFVGVGNCCLTGNFNNTTTTYSPGSSIGTTACFAETMIRVPNAGAVAYIGCSPYSYWYEDFYWAVGAHSYSAGSYPTTSASSTGVYDAMFDASSWNSTSALLYVGNLAVQQAVTNGNTNSSATDGNCNNSAHYYFQFYHTFGDGSVMPYITKPEVNTVTLPSTVASGATSITVNALAGSYVAVTDNSSVIYGVAEANSSGVATVTFTNAIPSSGTLYVVVTRQQYQPYFGTISISGGSSTTYYTVSATASPTAGGTVSGAGTYAANTTCALTATPATGYEFTNWKKGSTVVSTNATYSFTVTENATYTATFTETATPDPDPEPSGEATEITIGSGTSTNAYIPTYAYYKYSLTEQIYTAAEIGQSGTITAISFKVSNAKSTTRTVDLYMKHTSMTAFTSKTGWEALSSSYKVFSGSVTFSASGWTTITLDTPFEYNGTDNLVVGMDDNTGTYVSSSSNSPKFYVYSTSANRALRIYSDNTNYNPASPTSYSGTYVTSNNQIVFAMNGEGGSTPVVNTYTITATANPTAGGTVTGAGTYDEGATVTLTATAASGYEFVNWTSNGTSVSTNATYSFTATANAAYVAVFEEEEEPTSGTTSEITIGSGTSTNAYLPTYAYYKYSLTEQIYTAAEIGQSGTITAISFKVSNAKSTTRTLAIYLKHTTKTAFTSKKGWESVSSSYLVYSGSVTFSASGWTTITLDTPFEYNGTSNLLLAVDDNTGTYVSSSSNSPMFYVYSTSANRALRIYSDRTNYNPASPSSYSGTYVTSNNQIMLTIGGGNKVMDEEPSVTFTQEAKTLSVYPNPVERGINAIVVLPEGMTEAKIEVFNAQGACVYSGQGEGKVKLPCNERMTPGLYIIRACSGKDVFYGKLIVR
ncbi:MAG: lysine-specific cysteine proteinase Kgp [bacterium F083]|nr:MAG: lysine-specific cysteine proteinase Kgp [bacterium F083]